VSKSPAKNRTTGRANDPYCGGGLSKGVIHQFSSNENKGEGEEWGKAGRGT